MHIYPKLFKAKNHGIGDDKDITESTEITYKTEDAEDEEVKTLNRKSAEEALGDEIKNRLIVREELGHRNQFLVFDNPRECYDMMKNVSFHEVIMGNMAQKLRFDFDLSWHDSIGESQEEINGSKIIKANSADLGILGGDSHQVFALKAVKLLIACVVQYTVKLCGNIPYFYLYKTSDQPEFGAKQSFHVIVGAYCQNYMDAQYHANEIYKIYGEQSKYALEHCLDLGIYKSTQSFRMPKAFKFGTTRQKILAEPTVLNFGSIAVKIKPLFSKPSPLFPDPDYANWLYSLVTYIDRGLDIELPAKNIYRRNDPFNIALTDVSTVHHLPDGFNAILGSHLDGFRPQKIEGNLVLFERYKPSYCKICSREHEKDHSLMVIITKTNYIVMCRRKPGAKIVLWINSKSVAPGHHIVVDNEGNSIEVAKQKRQDTLK